MIETLKTLCALNGVSGDEDAVRDYLRTQAEPYADSIRTDALGNLIVFKRGRRATGNKVLLCAHMDEVGLIVTRATEDGFLRFDFVGGVDRRVVLGKPVELGPDRVPGIVGMKAIHMLTAEERKKVPKTESLYLDIGASDKEEALSKVPLGTYGAFVGEPEELGDGFLKSKAIDDRVGCAILLELLKEDLPLDVTFAFTAQEEVGTRGAFGAAFSVTPEIALVLVLAAGVWVLLSAAEGLTSVAALMEELAQLAGLDRTVVEPVFKTVVLSILTKLTGEVCRSAGEGGLASAVEIAGTVLALAAALPLVRGVMELMAEMLV